jgi:hypothetical protein
LEFDLGRRTRRFVEASHAQTTSDRAHFVTNSHKGLLLGRNMLLDDDVAEQMRGALTTGRYNLLLGSGVSKDSYNGRGKQLLGAEQLRQTLCRLVGANDGSTLQRVYSLLTEEQRATEVAERYANCVPGPSLKLLPSFLWQNIFTFNIDDVVENLYDKTLDRKQTLSVINFNDLYRFNEGRADLPIIHLHGFVRQFLTAGLIFSVNEYIRVIRAINPWMNILSQCLATEPFIISGTSLNEVDLEYFLSSRTDASPRKTRGPSFLVEPYPDAGTHADCKRYGLRLVQASIGEFLSELEIRFPRRPTVEELTIPDLGLLFREEEKPKDLLTFFTDFELVRPVKPSEEFGVPSRFYYGQSPTWNDLANAVDVQRSDYTSLTTRMRNFLNGKRESKRIFVVIDDAGTGKTTMVKRVAYDLSKENFYVLYFRGTARLDFDGTLARLQNLTQPVVLVFDNFGDHADLINDLVFFDTNGMFIVLSAERGYRREYLDLALVDVNYSYFSPTPLDQSELKQLIEKYRILGIVGDKLALREPEKFIPQIADDPITVLICRILHDFKPLESILSSLWKAADEVEQDRYLICALSRHCYAVGIRYNILQSSNAERNLESQIDAVMPLSLSLRDVDSDFVIPTNSSIAENILSRTKKNDPGRIFDAFVEIAVGIAPYVSPDTIRRRSPEARLAGRLFDFDKIVSPWLGERAEEFYDKIRDYWKWNSRYWEQRSLLAMNRDIEVAIQYARHAVAIERHPFTLTTLGKVLLHGSRQDERNRIELFVEGFNCLNDAINHSFSRNARINVQPYVIILNGTAEYLESGNKLNLRERQRISRIVGDAQAEYGRDQAILEACRRLQDVL